MLKRYFIITNSYNCVVYADGKGKAYMIPEQAWDANLTLEVAKATDYSNFDGCETVEDCAACNAGSQNIIDFDINDYGLPWENAEGELVACDDTPVAIEF